MFRAGPGCWRCFIPNHTAWLFLCENFVMFNFANIHGLKGFAAPNIFQSWNIIGIVGEKEGT